MITPYGVLGAVWTPGPDDVTQYLGLVCMSEKL
eukprot:CAMPEP_0176338832 /NCGR_PEP_ID=MMETSP0126-20121128/274_1 /TAXON_ID=141414 ORGANISM="Strombidinopsis acuminatum, Strain SPMC142" /NCGR_SAMPLE_ID=MMETSP0126 /ASSEMBLY_ACC=CAM_ASM_000229 /LENGTH=32 /DNA_ID= /DNA_START= /DNA_END= /DNA_ORIENTATION=